MVYAYRVNQGAMMFSLFPPGSMIRVNSETLPDEYQGFITLWAEDPRVSMEFSTTDAFYDFELGIILENVHFDQFGPDDRLIKILVNGRILYMILDPSVCRENIRIKRVG